MHFQSVIIVAIISAAVIIASPVPLRSLSIMDKGLELTSENQYTKQPTTDTPSVTRLPTVETVTTEPNELTTETVPTKSFDLSKRSRQIRSVSTESVPKMTTSSAQETTKLSAQEKTTPSAQEITTLSAQETTTLTAQETTTPSAQEMTTTEFILDQNKILSANWSLLCLQAAIHQKMEDLQTEAGFQSFNEEIALINRPVLENGMEEDSAACINIHSTLVKIVEVLDAFHPYTEAIGDYYIRVFSLRSNICMMAGDLSGCYNIPTSGLQVPESTQDTIYTLIALTYQNRIIQNVINNLDLC